MLNRTLIISWLLLVSLFCQQTFAVNERCVKLDAKNDDDSPCAEYVSKLVKVNPRKQPNSLLYDPTFVKSTFITLRGSPSILFFLESLGSIGDEKSAKRLNQAACIMSTLRCGSFGPSVSLCHSFRYTNSLILKKYLS